MRPIRTILVAIKDPGARSHPALDKAVQLARGLHARLELFHALTFPVYANSDGEFNEIGKSEREQALQRLERLASRAGGRARSALKISVSAAWDHPAYEAVVRRAGAIRADFIVAERHLGQHLAPALLHFNDWELLRQSPVPVLIVKNSGSYRRPTVLAAVDPSRDMGKPAGLDQEILAAGQAVTAALAGRLHTVHAYEVVYDQLRPQPLNSKAAELTNGRIRAVARKRYERLLSRYRVPPARRHLLCMAPADAIESVADRIGADIVVLGALSRSGWKRLLIGNTAETVLDPLRSDLLVIKPLKFASPVSRASRGARLVPVNSLMVA